MNKFSTLSLFALILLLLFSCKKDREKVYNVPTELEEYVNAFEAAGNVRGEDLNIDDLIVEYGFNLELDGTEAAGICNFETNDSAPIIELDTTSENWQAHEHSKETLIFHELGHCILNRQHTNSLLPNNNYKSIMKASGEPVYAEFCLFKKDYYLTELFNPSVDPPAWAYFDYGDVSVAQKSALFSDDFNNNQNQWFVSTTDEEVNATVGEGVYRIQNKIDGPRYVFQNINLDANKDFEIEMSMKIVDGGNFTSGLLWGSRNGTPNVETQLLYFSINNIRLSILLDTPSGEYTSLPSFAWDVNDFNKITIRRTGEYVYFFINENAHDVMSFQEFYGNVQGVLVAGETTIEVDYFNVYEINN